MLREEMDYAGDCGSVIRCTLSDEDMGVQFDAGQGKHKGARFTAWTETRGYFPVDCDGAEWVGSAPRDPCEQPTKHQGGIQ